MREEHSRFLRRWALRWGIHACWSPALVVVGLLVASKLSSGLSSVSGASGQWVTALYLGMGLASLVSAAYMALLESTVSAFTQLRQRDRIPYYAGLAGFHTFAHAIWMMAWPITMRLLDSSLRTQVQPSKNISDIAPFMPMMLGIVLIAQGCVLLIVGLVRAIGPRRPSEAPGPTRNHPSPTGHTVSWAQTLTKAVKWALVTLVGIGVLMLSRELLSKAILPNGAPDPHQVWVMARIAIVVWVFVVMVLLRLPTRQGKRAHEQWKDEKYGDHGQSPG